MLAAYELFGLLGTALGDAESLRSMLLETEAQRVSFRNFRIAESE